MCSTPFLVVRRGYYEESIAFIDVCIDFICQFI